MNWIKVGGKAGCKLLSCAFNCIIPYTCIYIYECIYISSTTFSQDTFKNERDETTLKNAYLKLKYLQGQLSCWSKTNRIAVRLVCWKNNFLISLLSSRVWNRVWLVITRIFLVSDNYWAHGISNRSMIMWDASLILQREFCMYVNKKRLWWWFHLKAWSPKFNCSCFSFTCRVYLVCLTISIVLNVYYSMWFFSTIQQTLQHNNILLFFTNGSLWHSRP